ncbi:hypothetical protein [Nocardiopsis nanhaiensis]
MPTRRLRSLAVLEHLNIALYAAILFGVLGMPATPANLAGFGLFALLLLQGGAYWWLKLRQLRNRTPHPPGIGILARCQPLNLALFTLGGTVIAWAAATGATGTHLWPGLALWAFAALEHVNYFHLQLSHDNRADLARLCHTRRLHRSHLARDLQRHRAQRLNLR